MEIFKSINEARNYSLRLKKQGKKVAVVPTMGFLHEGHLSLVDIAKANADYVIVTIFVNPTQFAPGEDLEKYPRDFERDKQLCEERGVDAIFCPEPSEMYPDENTVWVNEERLSKELCGKSRPIHFRGVLTVVAKLFNITLPDVAVFGQKDFQQAAIIKRMVRDLNFPVEIITGTIVRESDGLAMSSRNKYLSSEERQNALSISRSLSETAERIKKNKFKAPSDAKDFISKEIISSSGKVDYIEIVDSDSLEPVEFFSGEVLIAVAAFFGPTRLIDNILVQI